MSKLRDAIERISRWMLENDAPLLAQNLAPGASEAELARAEKQLGFPIPPGLRELWSLHNGQFEEMNGFVESLDLLSLARAVDERDSVIPFVEFLREDPSSWKRAGVVEAEALSDRWVPFAGRDSNLLAVSAVSGRVFHVWKDAPPLQLAAESVEAWATSYADAVEADDFAVEEGFGEYHLSRRDRVAEAREAEAERKYAERERLRRETPLLEQLRTAIGKNDSDGAQSVLEDLHAKSAAELAGGIDVLFAAKVTPTFLAETLRPLLNVVKLTPDHWVDVAEGGAVIENNAVRDLGLARCVGRSAQRIDALVARVAAERAERPRKLLEELLRSVRAKSG
jgi:hypothetical protein